METSSTASRTVTSPSSASGRTRTLAWLRRWVDWLFVIARQREAREQIAGRSAWQRVALPRARSCLRLADHAGQLASPESEFASEGVGLLRWSCLWALSCDADEPRPLDALVPPSPGRAVLAAAGGQERWETLRGILRRVPFDEATMPAGQADADRQALRALAVDLIASQERPERDLLAAACQAGLRVFLASLGAVAIATAVSLVTFRARLGPNLVQGRPWTTSSTLAGCDLLHGSCGGVVTAILFHTQEEESPWVEFDLGEGKSFRRVDVRNRIDCCQDRAIPLVLEASDDGTHWAEVARRDETFARWTARFAPRRARFVRLRVPRKTWLHLEEIAIR